MKPPIRLEETVYVGRLDTLAQVFALLESLDDMDRKNRICWNIVSRQTRRAPEKKTVTTQERSVLL